MALRLLQIVAPKSCEEDIRRVLEHHPAKPLWIGSVGEDVISAGVRVDAEDAESLMDELDERFGGRDEFQALLLSVAAALPREKEPPPAEEAQKSQSKPRPSRIGREELKEAIEGASRCSRVFVAMVVLSAIVVAFGLMRDNVAVVIGAMVIAPLLGPNIALALGATLGDLAMIRRAALTNVLGFGIALAITVGIGVLVQTDAATPEIASRLEPKLIDLILAIAAGAAGALAFTTGAPQAVVGVMVAVALLPPTAVVGMLVGSGQWRPAGGAAMLLAMNVIAINLASTGVFFLQGVRPRSWWDAERARKASKIAMGIWGLLLACLLLILALAGPFESGQGILAN